MIADLLSVIFTFLPCLIVGGVVALLGIPFRMLGRRMDALAVRRADRRYMDGKRGDMP